MYGGGGVVVVGGGEKWWWRFSLNRGCQLDEQFHTLSSCTGSIVAMFGREREQAVSVQRGEFYSPFLPFLSPYLLYGSRIKGGENDTTSRGEYNGRRVTHWLPRSIDSETITCGAFQIARFLRCIRSERVTVLYRIKH